jgi:hypothetical protein
MRGHVKRAVLNAGEPDGRGTNLVPDAFLPTRARVTDLGHLVGVTGFELLRPNVMDENTNINR